MSKEFFEVRLCRSCDLRYTAHAPCETAIQRYYQSEQYISHNNTRKGLINRLYHLVRSITLRSKVALVRKASGRQMGMHLDYGAGTGAFLHAMEKAGWNSIGLEPDAGARQVATRTFNAAVYPLEDLSSLVDGTYTVITLWHVLEHVHALHTTLERLKRVLAPGGVMVIAVPNPLSADAKVYGSDWAAWDVPRHLYHFSPASMRTLLLRHGLEVAEVKRMWFDSFYVGMLSEQYRKGSLVRGVWQGFLSNLRALFHTEQCSSLVYLVKRKA
ncbi:MAG TPA: class I SAM-dependent methyltransferase [Lacibacter sp.]|nr:class I SAM-dependent methyltransferase [Lacibacter sp.]HMO89605.1 class I SAM-dependent methyltransferase [Lacibacter sp.]HMP86063.1 class I SAM-dependent methyltransferase [Lacibacter sp.]